MKPKVAFYWCAACGGCEEMVVDLAEGILDVVRPWTSCSGRWPWISRRPISRLWKTARSPSPSSTARAHQRAGGMGPPAAPQVASRHRRGSLRPDGRHSRPGELLEPRRRFPDGLPRCAQHPERRGRPSRDTHQDNGFTLTLPRFFDTVKAPRSGDRRRLHIPVAAHPAVAFRRRLGASRGQAPRKGNRARARPGPVHGLPA